MTNPVTPKPKKPNGGRRHKAKGAVYERELAAYLNERLGISASRAPLSGGGKVGLNAGGADLLGVPDLLVEAKRVERLPYREAMRQAEENVRKTQTPDIPVVITRKNLEPTGQSIVMLRLDDFLRFYGAYLIREGVVRADPPGGGSADDMDYTAA